MALYPWMSQSSNAVMQAWSLDPAGLNPPAADQNGDRGLGHIPLAWVSLSALCRTSILR